ncbi:MAG TPA: hypothetical protein VG755_20060 [Nannocystaceae bacterium]|nr:hypothetical protein [Nannocystaceae bacterium]
MRCAVHREFPGAITISAGLTASASMASTLLVVPTMSARASEPVPTYPTQGLDDLISELGEVEWLGPQLRERAQDPFFAAARRHDPSVLQRLRAWTH